MTDFTLTHSLRSEPHTLWGGELQAGVRAFPHYGMQVKFRVEALPHPWQCIVIIATQTYVALRPLRRVRSR